MSEPLNMVQFCAAVGVERLTVLRWVKKGLPCTRQKGTRGGRASLLFDQTAAMAWVAANGSLTAGRKAAALARSPIEGNPMGSDSPPADSSSKDRGSESPPSESEPPRPKRIPVTLDQEVAREPGLLGNLERIKYQEVATSGALLRAKQGNDAGLIAVLSERHLAESKTLAALEQAALNYRTRTGELGPKAEMQNVFERIIIGIKNAILGMPSSVIPQIIPYLRDPEQAHEVRAIIDRAARDSLRTVSKRT